MRLSSSTKPMIVASLPSCTVEIGEREVHLALLNVDNAAQIAGVKSRKGVWLRMADCFARAEQRHVIICTHRLRAIKTVQLEASYDDVYREQCGLCCRMRACTCTVHGATLSRK